METSQRKLGGTIWLTMLSACRWSAACDHVAINVCLLGEPSINSAQRATRASCDDLRSSPPAWRASLFFGEWTPMWSWWSPNNSRQTSSFATHSETAFVEAKLIQIKSVVYHGLPWFTRNSRLVQWVPQWDHVVFKMCRGWQTKCNEYTIFW